jgi:hypothetical protein
MANKRQNAVVALACSLATVSPDLDMNNSQAVELASSGRQGRFG